MKLCNSIIWVLACCVAAATGARAQQQPVNNPPVPAQSKPASDGQKPAQPPAGSSGNPFPEDTGAVPVMPNGNSAVAPEAAGADAGYRVPLPANDTDPVRSPEDTGGERSTASNSSSSESSSSVADLDKLLPRDDEDTNRKGKKGKEAPEYHETAASDIDVGNFELDRRHWQAALSRFQSAMILDPENPEVFWGMAEAARHLGNFALARGYYQKVVDYDPDSRRGKDARKALKDPEIANAQSAAKTQAAQPQK